MKITFPNDFHWGPATAALQVEGATDIDGQGVVHGAGSRCGTSRGGPAHPDGTAQASVADRRRPLT